MATLATPRHKINLRNQREVQLLARLEPTHISNESRKGMFKKLRIVKTIRKLRRRRTLRNSRAHAYHDLRLPEDIEAVQGYRSSR